MFYISNATFKSTKKFSPLSQLLRSVHVSGNSACHRIRLLPLDGHTRARWVGFEGLEFVPNIWGMDISK